MSNALVDNIGNASGSLTTPTEYVVRGSAKAWANLNGQGTIALRDSLNVSSLVDNGTGDYTFNFSNAMASSNNAANTGNQMSASGGSVIWTGTRAYSASNLQIACAFNGGSATYIDLNLVVMELNGDLA